MHIIAIDPGPQQSAVVRMDTGDESQVTGIIESNAVILPMLVLFVKCYDNPRFVVEMIASYGMPVGSEVFETCVWIGKFEQAIVAADGCSSRLFRREVKLALCGTACAKDSNVRQALIDLYGPGKEKAIGLKKSPGPLYGFKKDMWAALGVAVTYAKQRS